MADTPILFDLLMDDQIKCADDIESDDASGNIGGFTADAAALELRLEERCLD